MPRVHDDKLSLVISTKIYKFWRFTNLWYMSINRLSLDDRLLDNLPHMLLTNHTSGVSSRYFRKISCKGLRSFSHSWTVRVRVRVRVSGFVSFTPAEFFVRLLRLCSHTHKSFFFYLICCCGWSCSQVTFGFLYHLQMRELVTSSRTRGFFFVFVLFCFFLGVFLGCCICLQARSSSSIKSWSNNVAPWEKGFFSFHQGR